MPEKISTTISEPDDLIIKFVESAIFVDKADFSVLSEDLTLTAKLPPQMSEDEMLELSDLSTSVKSAMASITIGILILQVCLHFGLKYLWNIMNLVQFLIFM